MNKIFPTISLTTDQLPEMKNWDIGKQYRIMITVEMTGVRKAEKFDLPHADVAEGDMQNNNGTVGTFEIKDMQDETTDPVGTFEQEYANKMRY